MAMIDWKDRDENGGDALLSFIANGDARREGRKGWKLVWNSILPLAGIVWLAFQVWDSARGIF